MILYLLCQAADCPPMFYGTVVILQSLFTQIYKWEFYRSFFTPI